MRVTLLLRGAFHVLAAALLVALLGVRPTHAHSNLVRSEPAADEVVASAPGVVKLWFSEELKTAGSTVEVVGASGKRVDRADGKVDLNDPDRKLLVISLAPQLPHGSLTVHWTAVSADDGDTTRGELTFHVGERPVGAAPRPAPSPAPGLHVDSPKDGAMVPGGAIAVIVHLEGGELHDLGHLHVFVDGAYVMQADDEHFTVAGLTTGEHDIKLELAGKDHFAWQPPVTASFHVHMEGGPGMMAGKMEEAGHGHADPAGALALLPRAGGLPAGAAGAAGLALAGAGLALRRLIG